MTLELIHEEWTLEERMYDALSFKKELPVFCQMIKTKETVRDHFFKILEDRQWIKNQQPTVFEFLKTYFINEPVQLELKIEKLILQLNTPVSLEEQLNHSLQFIYTTATGRRVKAASTYTICKAIAQKKSLTAFHLLTTADLNTLDLDQIRQTIVDLEDTYEALLWFPNLPKKIQLKLLDHGPQGLSILSKTALHTHKIDAILSNIDPTQDKELFFALVKPDKEGFSPIYYRPILNIILQNPHWFPEILHVLTQIHSSQILHLFLDAHSSTSKLVDFFRNCPDKEFIHFLEDLAQKHEHLLVAKTHLMPGFLELFAQAGKSHLVFKTLWKAPYFEQAKKKLISPNIEWLTTTVEFDLANLPRNSYEEQLILLPFTRPDEVAVLVESQRTLEHFSAAQVQEYQIFLQKIVKHSTQLGSLNIAQEELKSLSYQILAFLAKDQPHIILPLLPYFCDYQLACIVPQLGFLLLPFLLEQSLEKQADFIRHATSAQKRYLYSSQQLFFLPKSYKEWSLEDAKELGFSCFMTLYGSLSDERIHPLLNRLEKAFLQHLEAPDDSLVKHFFTEKRERIAQVQMEAKQLYTLKKLELSEEEIPEEFICALSKEVMIDPMLLPKMRPDNPDIWMDESLFLRYITPTDTAQMNKIVQGSTILHPFLNIYFERSLYTVHSVQKKKIEEWKKKTKS
jgi:hypothetical protein